MILHKSMFCPVKIELFFQLCLVLSVLQHFARAEPPYQLCSNQTDSVNGDPFQNNLKQLLLSIPSNASASKFYNTSFGNDSYRVYALYLCYHFISNDKCKDCLSTATKDITRLCPNDTEAVVWEEDCQLRYSNKSFFGQLDTTGNIPLGNKQNVSDPINFRSAVNKSLSNLTKFAAYDNKSSMYATGMSNSTVNEPIHGFVQCTPDLSPDACSMCLKKAIVDTLSYFYFSRGARLLSRSCYLRYELYDFLLDGGTGDAGSSGGSSQTNNHRNTGRRLKVWMIVILAIVSASLLIILLGLAAYCLSLREPNGEVLRRQVQLCDIGEPNYSYFLQQERDGLKPEELPFIDMATIRAATNNFSDSNMLGQGGFGPVYKGVLRDGREVAVKRLLSTSKQGPEEFTNEVLLLIKLQHKNLVRLWGFCVDGAERLLIYEYMPNSSLDVILFDPRKRAQLNWNKRINIIYGIARGILYLHEDSRLRILHRDLKASNVLLDKDMNPKISDFGIARIFGGREGETSTTTPVGTYGYMAPEYAMEGLYSIKSDVFSFGVLVIEMITGRRNAGFHFSSRAASLLAYAWQLWNEGKGFELVDPLLTDSYIEDEFLKYMQIGLLCVQEEAFDRPAMSSIVVMLKSEDTVLSQPNKPAFSVGRFTDHYETIANECSVNGLTISNVEPR